MGGAGGKCLPMFTTYCYALVYSLFMLAVIVIVVVRVMSHESLANTVHCYSLSVAVALALSLTPSNYVWHDLAVSGSKIKA